MKYRLKLPWSHYSHSELSSSDFKERYWRPDIKKLLKTGRVALQAAKPVGAHFLPQFPA